MAENVDDGDVHDGLELAQEHVGQQCAKYGCEVAHHWEGMVDGLKQIEIQDGAIKYSSTISYDKDSNEQGKMLTA